MAAGRRRRAVGLVAVSWAVGCAAREGGRRRGDGPPVFFDYDCDVVGVAGKTVVDWNALHTAVAETVVRNESNFGFPDEYRYAIAGPLAETAEEECPLGVLYLRIASFYQDLGAMDRSKEEMLSSAEHIQNLLASFPVYGIALSRWPIFHIFEHYSPMHSDIEGKSCEGVQGVLDWSDLRRKSWFWTNFNLREKDPSEELIMEKEAVELSISDQFFSVLRKVDRQNQAQDECLYGFYFLVANQAVAAAGRETQHMPSFNSILDYAMAEIPFSVLAGCGWPIFAVLVVFADMNKGLWFFGGDRKYLRGYSDWNLRRDELSPLVPSSLDFLSPAWREAAGGRAEALAQLSAEEYPREVRADVRRREAADGRPLRPIVQGLVDAALAVAAAAASQGSGRRMAYVVLLYGEKWARILERMARRLRQLSTVHPLFVVAIGEEAAGACRRLAATGQGVVCWTPSSQSQVHRFTAIHAMLHLGVDTLYMDMDTFLLRDLAPRVLQQAAAGPEALFARHGDADCVNIGVFYLKATARTAVWMSQFLAWYHDHPFEIDQRGLHVFLRLPSKAVDVAYTPGDLVEVSADVLEDTNEVVIGDVGWHGTLPRMLVFHWCHRPIELKEREIGVAYDAGDAVEAHGLPLLLAVAVARGAASGTPWARVLRFRGVLESYQKDEMWERTPCW